MNEPILTYEIYVAGERDWAENCTWERAVENFRRVCARENNSACPKNVELYDGVDERYPIKRELCGGQKPVS